MFDINPTNIMWLSGKIPSPNVDSIYFRLPFVAVCVPHLLKKIYAKKKAARKPPKSLFYQLFFSEELGNGKDHVRMFFGRDFTALAHFVSLCNGLAELAERVVAN